MFQNFMDYTDDKCRSLFTIEQKNRITSALKMERIKKDFIHSKYNVCHYRYY